MDGQEMIKRIGKEAYVKVEGLKIRVKVMNAKYAYGRIRWVVRPADPASAGELTTESVYFDD